MPEYQYDAEPTERELAEAKAIAEAAGHAYCLGVSLRILAATLRAMQAAEDLGGCADADEYISLMTVISHNALERAATARANKPTDEE